MTTNVQTVKTESSRGIGFLQILFVVFLTLKLTGVIGWSWWWVTAPLWIPWAIIGVLLAVLGVLMLLVNRAEKKLKAKRRELLTRRKP